VELLEVREGGAAGEDGDEVAVGELSWRKHPCGGAARGFGLVRVLRVQGVPCWSCGLVGFWPAGCACKRRTGQKKGLCPF
jgi:hypothetical protein